MTHLLTALHTASSVLWNQSAMGAKKESQCLCDWYWIGKNPAFSEKSQEQELGTPNLLQDDPASHHEAGPRYPSQTAEEPRRR